MGLHTFSCRILLQYYSFHQSLYSLIATIRLKWFNFHPFGNIHSSLHWILTDKHLHFGFIRGSQRQIFYFILPDLFINAEFVT